jgi:hypothetical protein
MTNPPKADKTIAIHFLDLNRMKSQCGYGKSHFPKLIYPVKSPFFPW